MRSRIALVLAAALLGTCGCVITPYRVSVRGDGVMAMPGGIIYDPRTETVRVLRAPGGEDIKIYSMEWSPDGKKLLVLDEAPPKEKRQPLDFGSGSVAELRMCDENGQNWKLLHTGGSAPDIAHWHPDGKRVTFWTSEGDINSLDLETGKINTELEHASPFYAWQPAGERLAAFQGSDVTTTPPFALTLVTASGGQELERRAFTLTAFWPWVSWSRDGKRILFCAPVATVSSPVVGKEATDDLVKKLSQPSLFSLVLETGQAARLTDRHIVYAEESPDGKHILFVEMVDAQKTRVGVMNPDGTGARVLDDGLSFDEKSGTGDPTEAALNALLCQPVWLSNTRVQYYGGTPPDVSDVRDTKGMWAIDIDGKNKEDRKQPGEAAPQ